MEWSPNQSPTMHAHYVRYTALELSVIPFELLHGTLQFGEPTKNYIRDTPTTCELRKEVLRAELYGGPASKSSKGRNRRKPKKPIYDPARPANGAPIARAPKRLLTRPDSDPKSTDSSTTPHLSP